MGCGELVPMMDPGSSILELIRLIKRSFRECEFDEILHTLMEREKRMKVEMENIVRDRDSLKKRVDFMEKTQGYLELEKCYLEEKLGRSERRGDESDKKIVQLKEKIEKLRSEKLDVEEQLVRSGKKCEEMDERLLKMGKVIEELRLENVYANKTIEELKAKETETVQTESVKTIDELRAKQMKSKDLDPRMLKLERALAKVLSVNVEDLAILVNGTDNFATAATSVKVEENVNFVEGGSNSLEKVQVNSDAEAMAIMSTTEVPATYGVRNLARSGTKGDDANMVCIYPDSEPASNSAVDENDEGKEPEIQESTELNHERATSVKRKIVEHGKDVNNPADDDFEERSTAKRKRAGVVRATVHERRNELITSYPQLACRSSPSCLFDALGKMNEKQKDAVKGMGFGSILKLRIKELPMRLGYWVVDNFDAQSCELVLLNNRRMHICEEDVYRVLGFPRGHRLIERIERHYTSDLYEEWKGFFRMSPKGRIVLRDLVDVMLACTDGGLWFKRHFMILVASSLIESTANGYIIPFIMRCLEDATRIREWNWAEYVIRSLIDNKITWEADKSKMFVGPSLFLMIFYVDRVVVFNQSVCRCFPVVINWDYKSLKMRQDDEIDAGGFGGGYPCDPIEARLDTELNPPHGSDMRDIGQEIASKEGGENYCRVLLVKTKQLATSMVDLMKMIEDAPESVVGNPLFQKVVKVAQKVIGCTNVPATQFRADKEPVIAVKDDEFWGNEDVKKSIEDIENFVAKRNEYMQNILIKKLHQQKERTLDGKCDT